MILLLLLFQGALSATITGTAPSVPESPEATWFKMEEAMMGLRRPETEDKSMSYTLYRKSYSADGRLSSSRMYRVRSEPEKGEDSVPRFTSTFVEITVDDSKSGREEREEPERAKPEEKSQGFHDWLRDFVRKRREEKLAEELEEKNGEDSKVWSEDKECAGESKSKRSVLGVRPEREGSEYTAVRPTVLPGRSTKETLPTTVERVFASPDSGTAKRIVLSGDQDQKVIVRRIFLTPATGMNRIFISGNFQPQRRPDFQRPQDVWSSDSPVKDGRTVYFRAPQSLRYTVRIVPSPSASTSLASGVPATPGPAPESADPRPTPGRPSTTPLPPTSSDSLTQQIRHILPLLIPSVSGQSESALNALVEKCSKFLS